MALYHSNDMAANDYFSHVSLNGDEVCDRAVRYVGTKYGVGENIARGTLNALTAMNGLYNSTGHRKTCWKMIMNIWGLVPLLKRVNMGQATSYI